MTFKKCFKLDRKGLKLLTLRRYVPLCLDVSIVLAVMIVGFVLTKREQLNIRSNWISFYRTVYLDL